MLPQNMNSYVPSEIEIISVYKSSLNSMFRSLTANPLSRIGKHEAKHKHVVIRVSLLGSVEARPS